MKNKACLKHIAEIEKMTDAVTQDSDFIKEYLEKDIQKENVAITASTRSKEK